MAERPKNARVVALVLGFACLYFVWGGTFLAIRIALDTIPPLLLCGSRLLLARLPRCGQAASTTSTSIRPSTALSARA